MEHRFIEKIQNMDEFSELINIQRDACSFTDINIVPLDIFKVVADLLKPNGLILRYFLDEQIVGFVMTLPTSNPKEVLAHIGDVFLKYQKKGIFYNLLYELKKY